MKTLKNFLQLIPSDIRLDGPHFTSDQLNLKVTGVTADSREVEPGTIFIAISGGTQDGHEFIGQAIRQGAVLVIGTALRKEESHVPYLRVALQTRRVLALLAAEFYGYPSKSLLMVGVTGTSGKTTTTYLIESVLRTAGHRVGLIGTVNSRFGNKTFPSTHTTPGAVELQRLLLEMKEAGCTAVVMEVSSHALQQRRVDAVAFDAVVFLNLSPEHLDFHPNMEDYFRSKAILFTDVVLWSQQNNKQPILVINSDDSYGRRLIGEMTQIYGENQEHPLSLKTFSVDLGLETKLSGIEGIVSGVSVRSQLVGDFNCSNIAAAVSVGQGLQISSEIIGLGISSLAGVPGRLERVENSKGIHVWVDYAHKPDALEKVLKTLRRIRGEHRLITVFGCGGDRDRKKRPVMGHIAVEGADHVFVTSDNPRTEDPDRIIEEILGGMEGFQNFSVEVDRRKAIYKAIESAKKGDLVLIAGKGHENYQIIGAQKVQFDDRVVALEAIQLLC